MGKKHPASRRSDDLALDVIAETIGRMPVTAFIRFYESTTLTMNKQAAPRRTTTVKKTLARRAVGKHPARKSKPRSAPRQIDGWV